MRPGTTLMINRNTFLPRYNKWDFQTVEREESFEMMLVRVKGWVSLRGLEHKRCWYHRINEKGGGVGG